MSINDIKAGTTYAAIVGRVLVLEREEMQLEQSTVAKHMGLSQSSWSRIERGDSIINVEQLHTVAAYLKTTAHDILQKADEAAQTLQERAVNVQTAKDIKKGNGAIALIGIAALTALVLAAISSR